MQKYNAENGSCERVEYREDSGALRGYVFLAERLYGKAHAAADQREREYGASFAAALRHAYVFKNESSDETEDGDEEELVD